MEINYTPDEAIQAGCGLEAEGRHAEAEMIYRAVLEADPGNFHAMNRLGVVLTVRKSYYEALYRFDRALKINRRSSMVLSNRAMVLGELGHHDEAVLDLYRAVGIDPKFAIGWSNLGNSLERTGRFKDAAEALSTAIKLAPDHALPYYNRGIVMIRLKRYVEALTDLDNSLALDPSNAEAVYNRGCVKLLQGDLAGGFADYEARLRTGGEQAYYVSTTVPKWAGEPLEEKTILLHSEQGLGDSIQFLRYVGMVCDRGAKVLLIVHTALLDLARKSFEYMNVEVLPPKSEIPAHDFYAPLMSLPNVFGTTLETTPEPWNVRESRTECSKCAEWQRLIGDEITKPGLGVRVGICWSGNFKHKNDIHRSIPFDEFIRPFAGRLGVTLYSFQKEVRQIDSEAFATAGVVDLSGHLLTMDDTAHALGFMDLVITVDTAVAHMAATMDVPTWILIPAFGQDWRWLLDRQDSPWYPSVRLIRQKKIGDWSPELSSIAAELANRALKVA